MKRMFALLLLTVTWFFAWGMVLSLSQDDYAFSPAEAGIGLVFCGMVWVTWFAWTHSD